MIELHTIDGRLVLIGIEQIQTIAPHDDGQTMIELSGRGRPLLVKESYDQVRSLVATTKTIAAQV